MDANVGYQGKMGWRGSCWPGWAGVSVAPLLEAEGGAASELDGESDGETGELRHVVEGELGGEVDTVAGRVDAVLVQGEASALMSGAEGMDAETDLWLLSSKVDSTRDKTC